MKNGWLFAIIVSCMLWVGVANIAYEKGHLAGRKEQQMKDFQNGGILIKSQDDRIKQLECALTTYKIDIPK